MFQANDKPIKYKIIDCAVLIYLILLVVNCLLFSYLNAIPYVMADGWRFIYKYLIPWSNGSLTLPNLFQDHHPSLIIPFMFILNAECFDLRMNYEGMIGVVFIIFCSFLMISQIRKYSKSYLSIIGMATVSMSLLCSVVYTWSLVTIGYIQFFFFMLLYLNIEKAMQTNNAKFISQYFLLVLFVLFFGDSAKLFVISFSFVVFVDYILVRDKKYIFLLFVFIISMITIKIIYAQLSVTEVYSGQSLFSKIDKIIYHFPEFVTYIGIGLLSAWVNIVDLKKNMNGNVVFIEFLGFTVIAVYCFTIYFYYRYKLNQVNKLPIIFILVSLLSALAAYIFRYNPEIQTPISANIPRYYRIYSSGMIGVFWVCTYLKEKKSKKIRSAVIFLMMILIFSHIYGNFSSWNQSKYIKKTMERVGSVLIDNGNGNFEKKPPIFILGKNYPQPYMDGLSFLKENELNLFYEK